MKFSFRKPDTEIDVHEVNRLLQSGDPVLLIDCREVIEHEFCRIPGSQLIPATEIPDRIQDVAKPDQRIIVYCHRGVRSRTVANWLRQNGYPAAQNLTGGIEQWSLQIDPDVPRY